MSCHWQFGIYEKSKCYGVTALRREFSFPSGKHETAKRRETKKGKSEKTSLFYAFFQRWINPRC